MSSGRHCKCCRGRVYQQDVPYHQQEACPGLLLPEVVGALWGVIEHAITVIGPNGTVRGVLVPLPVWSKLLKAVETTR